MINKESKEVPHKVEEEVLSRWKVYVYDYRALWFVLMYI